MPSTSLVIKLVCLKGRFLTLVLQLQIGYGYLSWTPLGSYADWLNWFNSIRLSSKVKDLLEGVLYITWWSVWMFRNQLLFSSKAPRKDVIFDDIATTSKGYVEYVQYLKEAGRADGGRVFACTQPRRLAVQVHDIIHLSAIAKKTPAYYWWILLALLGIELSNSAEKAGHISGVHHV
ncbi:hypothetical protein Tco_0580305 [Tanacetum coccineum]